MGKNKELIRAQNRKEKRASEQVKKAFVPAPNAKERELAALPPVETTLDFDPFDLKIMFPPRVPYAN